MSDFDTNRRRFEQTQSYGDQLVRDVDLEEWALPESEVNRIRPVTDWCDEVIDYFTAPAELRGAYLPWAKTQNLVRLRAGELSIWGGLNNSGKSALLSQVMLALARQDLRVCIASFEMPPRMTMARMARQALQDGEPSPSEIRAFHASLECSMWLYDQWGTIKPSRVYALARYCREHLRIDHLVLDSLMKCGTRSDDYSGQAVFVDTLATYCRNSGIHVHLVAHERKRDPKAATGGGDPGSIRGAGEITDLADNVFLVERNFRKEEQIEKDPDQARELAGVPDTTVHVRKQRHGDFNGRLGLYYVKHAMQFVARPGGRTIDFMNWQIGGFDE